MHLIMKVDGGMGQNFACDLRARPKSAYLEQALAIKIPMSFRRKPESSGDLRGGGGSQWLFHATLDTGLRQCDYTVQALGIVLINQ